MPLNLSTPSPERVRRWYLFRPFVAATLLVIGLVLATAVELALSYREAVRAEQQNLLNLAIAFSAQTQGAVQLVDQLLLQTQQASLQAEKTGVGAERLLHLKHRDLMRDHLALLSLYGSDGNLISSLQGRHPMPSASDIPASVGKFLPTANELQVAVHSVDSRSGEVILRFSRPLLDGASQPAGLIVALVHSQYFQELFSSISLGIGGSVTLLNLDGTMLVRGPNLPAMIGKSMMLTPLFQEYLPHAKRGVIATSSPIAKEKRVYGYDAVQGYPLVVITGKNETDAVAYWRGRMWIVTGFLTLLSILVFYLAWRVRRDAQRQASLIVQLQASEKRLAKSADYLSDLLNTMGNPAYVLDAQHCFVIVNRAFARLVNRQADELAGLHEAAVFDGADAAIRRRAYEQAMSTYEETVTETVVHDVSGDARTVLILTTQLANEDGVPQLVNVITDITDHKRAEVRIAYLADYDLLTELPNQTSFRRSLQAELHQCQESGQRVALLAIYLGRLQEIIDLLGHEEGDRALRHAAATLHRFLERTRGIGRIATNGFALLVQYEDPREVDDIAAELSTVLTEPYLSRSREFYLGPMIGIALYPQDASNADDLLRQADIASNRAAIEGARHIQFFTKSVHASLDERLTIESQLRRALARKELRVVYQPKVSIASGRIVGFEALLRWVNPLLGEISPARFIPIAESTGLIVAIGQWVLHEAAGQAAAWSRESGRSVKVAVNLSPRQFNDTSLTTTIHECIESTGIAPDNLELEITESAVMGATNEGEQIMSAIRALGVALSIDDFGTGYSSLARLKHFPVSRLKIDRAFVQDLDRDSNSVAIVQSILTLAHGLQVKVVAEGVETETQLAFLRDLQCDEYQGYLFSRPLDVSDVMPAIKRNDYLCDSQVKQLRSTD